MPSITIEVANDEFWRQELDGLHKDILANIKKQTAKCAYLIRSKFKIYPPKRQGSTYIRTYRLGDSAKVTDTISGWKVSIDPVSPKGVHYGTYVIGDMNGQGQAWMHKGFWPLLKEVADQASETMFNDTENQMQTDIRTRGLS